MYTLIIDINNFSLYHDAHLFDETEGIIIKTDKVKVDDIVEYICETPKINKVQLNGITEFCFGLKEEIETKLATEYANHNIEIEVL